MADLPHASPLPGTGDLPSGLPPPQGMATAMRPGQVLCQRYELKARIGVGGMGEVFSALDRVRGEEIAIKVLLPHLLQHSVAQQRFAAEAKISIELAHPNIVNVFDLQREGEYRFLTMELLEGRSLRDWMNSRADSRTPYSVDEVLQLAQAVGGALDYAHKKTVHRDVKPENIWVCENAADGAQYKLMDFGIARLMSNSQMNQTRTAMGTAYYMAPEQLISGVEVDARADQFSLAVVLYELLAGEKPLGRAKSLHERNRKVPKAMSLAIDKALSPRPHERFPSMAGIPGRFAFAQRGDAVAGHGLGRSWRGCAGCAAGLYVPHMERVGAPAGPQCRSAQPGHTGAGRGRGTVKAHRGPRAGDRRLGARGPQPG